MKKAVCMLLSVCLLLMLGACAADAPVESQAAEPTVQTTAPEAPATEPEEQDTQPVEDNTAGGETAESDALTTVLSALNSESVFYSGATSMAFYFTVDMEKLIAGTAGILHYGKSVLYGTNLLYAYLPSQQSEILEKLQSLDISALANTLEISELTTIQQHTLQTYTDSSTFSTYIENPDEGSYGFEVYLYYDDAGTPMEIVIKASAFELGLSAYYWGEYDETVCGGLIGLEDMEKECRESTEVLADTAIITLPGGDSEITLPRWQNVQLVNIVDGAAQEEPVQPEGAFDEAAYDAKITIDGDEYLVYLDARVVSYESNTYPLTDGDASMLGIYIIP